jgi:hypothetical protein
MRGVWGCPQALPYLRPKSVGLGYVTICGEFFKKDFGARNRVGDISPTDMRVEGAMGGYAKISALRGLEPATFRFMGVRANLLSHRVINLRSVRCEYVPRAHHIPPRPRLIPNHRLRIPKPSLVSATCLPCFRETRLGDEEHRGMQFSIKEGDKLKIPCLFH